jgi:hypothetical protein|tara:strand:- start:365 stop:643 length:279 start_codon:yes stop_codon:yes gene_type:complete
MTIDEFIGDYDIDDGSPVVFHPGMEEAFLGFSFRFNDGPLATYDRDKVMEIYIRDNKWTYEEALEWFDFNDIGAWVGEKTPVYMILYSKEGG